MAIKHDESRDTGNIGHTRHMTKTTKTQKTKKMSKKIPKQTGSEPKYSRRQSQQKHETICKIFSEYDISELDLSNLPDKIENILNCPITEDDIQLAIRNFK